MELSINSIVWTRITDPIQRRRLNVGNVTGWEKARPDVHSAIPANQQEAVR